MSEPIILKTGFIAILALVLLQGPAHAQDSVIAHEGDAFTLWLDDLRVEAAANGISKSTIDLAFSEVTAPVQRIINNDRAQPEKVQTYADYLNARVSEWKQNKGRELFVEHESILQEIAREYGVQARFIVSIWGMETNFGTYPITEPIFNALATLAYDNRRAAFFRAQFMAALVILDSGFPPYEKMKSSWAGAMGQSQFLPENYLRLAVDYDGDGKRDIWDTEADVFASIANYFRASNWQDDQTYGRRVILPTGGESSLRGTQDEGLEPDRFCRRYESLGAWRDLQEWQRLGVRRADGSDLPTRSISAALVLGDSGDGEGFIVYRNFCSIMGFNPAYKYALSIGLLSDFFDEK